MATYYVSPSGSNSNPGTISQPFLTIAKGLSVLGTGDTLYLRAGTYVETIDSNVQTIPTGTSWSNAPLIAAYPSETVVIQPSSGTQVINLAASYIQYLILDGFVVDALHSQLGISLTNGANHVRLRNLEVKNGKANHQGILSTDGADFNEFLNLNVHNNGDTSALSHGLYCSTSNNLIEGGTYHHNSGYGVHVFDQLGGLVNNVVRKVRAYNNGLASPDAAGILVGSGTGHIVYNCMSYLNPIGIMVGFVGAANNKVFNNVAYGNTGDGGIQIRNTGGAAYVRNNISYNNLINIQNYNGGSTTLSNNLTTNPLFVNPSAGDFHLQAGSPAINAGMTLSEVPDDADGVLRPQGPAYDIGAYEYPATAPAPTVSTVAPTSGRQGQTLSVTITGTQFVSGCTASFGTGITVNSVTFTSSSQLTASLTIAGGATAGARNVTVTNPDGQSGSLLNGFVVTLPPPTVSSISPTVGNQGQTLSVTITGTLFVSGATVSLGSGVTTNSVTFNSSTQLTASVTISGTATVGLRNVTVTNPDSQSASLLNAFTVRLPAPTLASVTPSSGNRGTTLNTVLAGTGFVSGCAVNFGAGITVNTVVFNSSTQLTVNITIASGATLGSRTVTVTNPDTQSASLAPAFTVASAAAPTVTSSTPSTGVQGQTLTGVIIAGTGFNSGATVSYGAGITVTSVTFNSSTQLTVNLAIAANAATGPRTVTVTNTSGQFGSRNNAFTVILPAPTVSSVSANSGIQGQTLSVTVTGTGFVSGCTSSFGAGITVNSTTFNSATQLTVSLTISPVATAGGRTIVVTNPDAQTGSLISGFTVNLAPPSVSNVIPNQGAQGQSFTVSVAGAFFVSGATLSLGAGITVTGVTFVSSAQLTATVTIDAGATLGARTATVTNPDAQVGSLANAFTVIRPAPLVTSVTPTQGIQGQTFSVTVAGTAFVSGCTVSFGAGITVNSVTFNSSIQLTTSITIASNANTGVRTVTVTNPDAQSGSLNNAFTVIFPAPTVSSVAPAVGNQGQTLTGLSLVGTGFLPGAAVSFGAGITVNAVTVNSATLLTVSLSIAAGATVGTRTVTVTNADAQSGSLVAGFTVRLPAPTLSSVSPTSGQRTATITGVVLLGTGFVSGCTVDFGSGVTINSVTFVSATRLTVSLSIDAAAALGLRTVTVTNPDTQAASLVNAFLVDLGPAPTVSSATPNSGLQGTLVSGVVIAGTGFVSGCTVDFGAGITVSSVTFNSSVQLTVNLTISGTAAGGLRTLTVTNPDTQTGSLVSGFTVTLPPPTVSSVTANAGIQGQTLTVTVAGTAFVSGATVSFGSGITINSVVFTSATQLTVNLSISATATPGTRNVTVTNPDTQSDTLTSGFTVNAAPPTISTITPNTGYQGQNISSVVIAGTFFVSGATVSFGAGVTVNSVTFNSSSQLTVDISISGVATAGTRDVTVTNPDAQSVTKVAGFTITVFVPAPTVSSITANTATQGQTLSAVIAGTGFVSGATVSLGAGVTVNSVTFDSSIQLTVSLTIANGATPGTRDVTVTNPDTQFATLAAGFTITAAPPTVTSVTPNHGAQGQTLTGVVIAGTFFVSGCTVSFGSGITINSVSFNSSTQLTVSISIAGGATTGARTVTVTNPDTQAGSLSSGFTVFLQPPSVTSLSVLFGEQGQTLSGLVINGAHFVSGCTVDFSAGITTNSVTFNSATQLTVSISIASGATLGARTVTVTNPDTQAGSLPAAFTVTSPAVPFIDSISPTVVARGATVDIVALGSGFETGATASFGLGITVNSVTVNSSTQLTINITVSASAAFGSRSLTVTNPNTLTGTLTAALTILLLSFTAYQPFNQITGYVRNTLQYDPRGNSSPYLYLVAGAVFGFSNEYVWTLHRRTGVITPFTGQFDQMSQFGPAALDTSGNFYFLGDEAGNLGGARQAQTKFAADTLAKVASATVTLGGAILYCQIGEQAIDRLSSNKFVWHLETADAHDAHGALVAWNQDTLVEVYSLPNTTWNDVPVGGTLNRIWDVSPGPDGTLYLVGVDDGGLYVLLWKVTPDGVAHFVKDITSSFAIVSNPVIRYVTADDTLVIGVGQTLAKLDTSGNLITNVTAPTPISYAQNRMSFKHPDNSQTSIWVVDELRWPTFGPKIYEIRLSDLHTVNAYDFDGIAGVNAAFFNGFTQTTDSPRNFNAYNALYDPVANGVWCEDFLQGVIGLFQFGSLPTDIRTTQIVVEVVVRPHAPQNPIVPPPPLVFIEGKLNSITGAALPMEICGGYVGKPAVHTQLSQVEAHYTKNLAPIESQLHCFHTEQIGESVVEGKPGVIWKEDPPFHVRQTNRYHRVCLFCVGETEVTGLTWMLREAGIR